MIKLWGLHRDERGVISLVGMTMAFVVAIASYYLNSVAQEVLIKTAGQTQADAEALEGAIWHAQGMNLLVCLNIAMAFILIPFLAVRLATLAIIVAIVAVAAFSWVPGVAGGLAPLTRALDTMHRTENRLARPTMNMLETITKSEIVVAAAVPWVAASLPVNRTMGNLSSFVFSISLLPDVDQWFKELGPTIRSDRRVIGGLKPKTQFPARMGNFPASGPPQGRHRMTPQTLGARMMDRISSGITPTDRGSRRHVGQVLDFLSGSLPAQEEDYFQVCSRSAQGLASAVTWMLTNVGLDQGTADSVSSGFGKFVGSIQTVTCTPLEEFDNKLAQQVTEQVRLSCEKKKEEYLGRAPGTPGRHQQRDRTWTVGQQQECEKKQREEAEKATKGARTRPSAEKIKTAAIWGEILIPQDSPLLHVWSLNMRFSPVFMPYTAEAEFYAPCDNIDHATGKVSGDGTDNDGRTCGDNAMWRFGWNAKNIRERSLQEEMVAHAGDFVQGWMNRFFAKAIQGVIGRIALAVIPDPQAVGRHRPGGGRHRAPGEPETPLDQLLSRHITGIRTTELGNGYWNRKWAGSQVGGFVYTSVGGVFH